MKIFLMIVVVALVVNVTLAIINKLVERSKNKMIDDFVREMYANCRQEHSDE